MPLNLASIIHINTIYSVLFAALTPVELAVVSGVSRSFYGAVQGYIRTTYNADKLLSPYFRDVLSFRSLQARTGTLIAGRSALHFFDRSKLPGDPLDVFVYFHRRREVVDWFLEVGFKFIPSYNQPNDLDFYIADVIVEERPSNPPGVCGILLFQLEGSPDVTVRLFVAARSPMEIVLCSHSTCMVNVISYEKAYCLFPRATLHDHHSLLMNHEDHYAGRALDIAELEEQGFTMSDELEPIELAFAHGTSGFVLGWRWIDDSATWIIKLNTAGVTLPPRRSPSSSALTHDPVAVCGFSLRYDCDKRAHVEYEIVDGTSIDYTYLVGDSDLCDRLLWIIDYRDTEWDGRYWDEEVRRVCKEILWEHVTFQRKMASRLVDT